MPPGSGSPGGGSCSDAPGSRGVAYPGRWACTAMTRAAVIGAEGIGGRP